jgi:hypothetical protein
MPCIHPPPARWILAAVVVAGCSPVPGLVRRIERERFCPSDRIVAKVRDDLRVHDFACLRQPAWRAKRAAGVPFSGDEPFWQSRLLAYDADCRREPPAEIRSDPARVAIWRDVRNRYFTELDTCSGQIFPPCAVRIVEVSACGVRGFHVLEGDNYLGDLGPADPAERP